MLTVGSLFAGIGGFDLGLERAGMRVRWQCEIDPYCRAVLARHWPGVPCFEDVCDLAGAAVEPVDVLCGGFPCEDVSIAGRAAGLAGARSGLWHEYARLVSEIRPRYVIVENVPALLARGLGTVLGELAALGYDAEWDCLPASAFGAPHRRDRVWIVAYPDGQRLRQRPERDQRDRGAVRAPERGHAVAADDGAAQPMADPELARLEGHRRGPVRSAPAARGGANVADAEVEPVWARLRPGRPGRLGDRRPGDGGRAGRGWWDAEPDVGRVADGIPARVDRLRALGNSLVPQIATWIGSRIVSWELFE